MSTLVNAQKRAQAKPPVELETFLRSQSIDFRTKRIIVFDLDNTVTASKMILDNEMRSLLNELLKRFDVAVIGAATYAQFKKQLLDPLNIDPERLAHLYIFPTSGTAFYRFVDGTWTQVYEEGKLTDVEKRKIIGALRSAFAKIGYTPPEIGPENGVQIEDRGTQVSFSPLGQQAGLEDKKRYMETYTPIKERLVTVLQDMLPEFQVLAGGGTTIDITRKGIDKAYAIKMINERLGYKIDEMVFIGDALNNGGNDFPVIATGVDCIWVKGGFQETKIVLKQITGAVAIKSRI